MRIRIPNTGYMKWRLPEDPAHLVEHRVHPGAHLLRVIRHQGVHRPLVHNHAVALVLIPLFKEIVTQR